MFNFSKGVASAADSAYHNYAIFPVLYVKTSTKIISGKGTQESPFVLSEN